MCQTHELLKMLHRRKALACLPNCSWRERSISWRIGKGFTSAFQVLSQQLKIHSRGWEYISTKSTNNSGAAVYQAFFNHTSDVYMPPQKEYLVRSESDSTHNTLLITYFHDVAIEQHYDGKSGLPLWKSRL